MKNLYNLFVLTLMCLCCVSCDNDEPNETSNIFSYRDGVYSKSQTELYVDGMKLNSVISVTLKSQLIMTNGSGTGYTGTSIEIDPVYNTQVRISGFPLSTGLGDIEFITLSDMSGFSGQTRIEGRNYSYRGEFTGDPLSHHDRQGIIISFELRP